MLAEDYRDLSAGLVWVQALDDATFRKGNMPVVEFQKPYSVVLIGARLSAVAQGYVSINCIGLPIRSNWRLWRTSYTRKIWSVLSATPCFRCASNT